MNPVGTLSAELGTLRSDIANHVAAIAQELARDIGIDEASIQRHASAIRTLSHKSAQVFPKISVAKGESLRNETSDPADWIALDRNAHEVRDWISQWPRVEELVRMQIPQRSRPLMCEPDDTVLSQMGQYDAVFDQLHKMLTPNSQSEDARDHGCFADITLPNSTFVAYAHAAYRVVLAQQRRGPTRFLDVGCGTGFKVMMAARYFDRCDGLEYDPAYARAAQQFLDKANLDGCRAFQADGLTYTEYDPYDVVYFYRPMREDDQLRVLETQILTHMRTGALVIAPYKAFEARYQSYGCARIFGWLYIANTSQSDADILRKRAERTGPYVGAFPPRGRGVWDPILDASAGKGFGLQFTAV